MKCGYDCLSSVHRFVRRAARMSLAIALLGLAGCASWTTPRMGLIAADPNGNGFIEKDSGQPFVPFGINYYDPNIGWPPQVWARFDPKQVAQHFQIMQELGANCVRVFLAAGAFQPDVNTVDPKALAKLDRLVKIARKANLRLILTGPGDWEGTPDYWKPDRFTGEKALKAAENFWTTVGRRYEGEPTILAWDLVNEPEMPWFVEGWQPRWNAWLQAKYANDQGLKAAWGQELRENEKLGTAEAPENVAKKGNPRLLDWQLFRESLADEWVQRQTEALRRADPTHMITVGYLQFSYPIARPGDPNVYTAFNPHRQKKYLDFISVHFYPFMGEPFESIAIWQQSIAYLQAMLAYCRTGIPLVLEEYGWYGGGAPPGYPYRDGRQQAVWLTAEIEASRRLVHGWLSWPFADTPDANDMSVYGGLVTSALHHKIWTVYFQAYAAASAILPQPVPPLPSFDFVRSLTTPLNELPAMLDEHAALVTDAIRKAGPLPQVPPPNFVGIKPME